MAGIKGMKTGGFSTGRPQTTEPKNHQIRVTDKEKELITLIRNKKLIDEILNELKNKY